MDIQRCFEILELDHNASLEELNQVYRDLATVWHPDRFPNNPRLKAKAEEKLKTINEAYEKLLAFLSAIQGLNIRQFVPKDRLGSSTNYNSDSDQIDTDGETQFKYPFNASPLPALTRRPWVRLFARAIDYMLLAACLKISGVTDILLGTDIALILFPIFLTTAWIIFEAALLSIFGRTPGKWILKTTVYDKFLLKPTFSGALRRSLSVWCNGLGMGVPFIAPVTISVAYYRIKKRSLTLWDHEGRFSIKHEGIGIARIVIATLSSAIMSYFIIFRQ